MSDQPSRGSSSPRGRDRCQSCGASGRRGQLICLVCGERMALEKRSAPSWRPAVAAAAAMVLTAGIALGFVISAASGGDERQTASAAPSREDPGARSAKPAPASRPAPAPQPALVRARVERGHRQSKERARRALAESAGGWPAGRSGYTVLLMSSDEESARAFATGVKEAGFEAGVLSAAEHPNLGGTLFTVFSGVYETQAEAATAAAGLRQAYPRGYVQFVEAPTASSGAPPAQPLPE